MKTKRQDLIQYLRGRDLAGLKAALRNNPDAAKTPAAIVEAGRLGWRQAVEVLLRNGADINASYRNYRALHSLIQEAPHKTGQTTPDRVACLKWVLAHGADPEQPGGWPAMRAILTAAMVGDRRYIDELKNGGAVVDGFVAAALGDVRRTELELSRDPAFAKARDVNGLTALHCASGSRLGKGNARTRKSLLVIADLLLKRGADVNATVRSWSHDVDAVYFAVSSRQREIFELLLERGADPTAALAPAVWTDLSFAEICLNRGAVIDRAMDEGKPLLNQMIRWGQFSQAAWLLEQGASPNVPDQQGWTALHQAASRGNEKMMKLVLGAGAQRARSDKEGATALDIARAKRRPKLVALLVARG